MSTQVTDAELFFGGADEAARTAAAVDWAAGPLGPVDTWPESLRQTARIMMSAGMPMLLAWGPELIQLYNDSYRRFIGTKHPGAMGSQAGQTWSEAWEVVGPMLEAVLDGQGFVNRVDSMLLLDRNGDHEETFWTFSYNPVTGPEGEVLGVLAVAHETTGHVLQRRHIHELDEHVAAEEMRAERILQRDAAKTRFYQNASHEFRTPLTVLHMAVEVLRPPIAPQAEGQLATISRAVDQLDRLVEELLTFVREERDALDPLLKPVNLAEATRTVTSMFRTLASRAGLELFTEIEPIGCVLVNPEAWNRIVANLVSNAVKYTPEGSVTVRLFSVDDVVVGRADLRTGGGGAAELAGDFEVHLEVVDTGMGIAEDDASAVFSRFGRGEAARSIDAGGLGLGLSMVDDLVRAHDGSIRVQSRAGEGSTFAVRLPRRPVMSEGDGEVGLTVEAVARVAETTVGTDPAAGILAPAHTPSELPDLEEAPSQGRLLLVEDDEDLRRYLTTFLTSEGWQVDAVADVPGALAFSQPPDLVLADVMLPGPSGLDLLRLLRTQSGWDRLPIVLLTARAAPHEVIEGLNAGADDYIVKPFRASELSARLAVHVEMAGRREQALIEGENRSDNLHEALKSNRRIGLSLGILMSRYRVTDEVAFEMLRRVSNDSNQRIRDIAEEVILTGSLDTSQRARPDPSLREQEVGRGRVPDGDQ
ncbi:MAG: response regulator [Dermatophilus congolensis]|nr:response regulator [Dermatophilus congolensis]